MVNHPRQSYDYLQLAEAVYLWSPLSTHASHEHLISLKNKPQQKQARQFSALMVIATCLNWYHLA